ncbi:MAG TPA: PadR family transcriptional regulator [Dissulfurispiraceae bacterium]|nr:PadR family transcriptional regulator [Dissulfurispiraceae bacterium]
MLRDVFLGFIKVHILHHASKEPVYGVWLIEELNQHGYKIGPGTLYPTLHKLEQEKLLKSHVENHQGKIRKYYKITARGARMLMEAKKKVTVLVDEIHE